MKKITFLIVFFCSIIGIQAQVLNENAAWPNGTWTITGTYATAVNAFEADPTVTANFAFDDDDAANGHEDNIAAESPIIDLTAAYSAGETWIFATADYGYYYLADDVLRFEYWNADTSTWVAWGASIPGNSTTVTDNFCTIPKTNIITPRLDISTFTPTQLSGFRYRIYYNDSLTGADWNYGFCFDSPTIYSQTPPACPTPIALGANTIVYNGANLFWTENGTATLWNVEYGVTGFTQGTGTMITGATNPQSVSLSPLTTYQYYVQADCGSGTSAWAGPFSFSTPGTPPANDNCSGAIALTVNSDFLCGTTTSGTITHATASGINDAGCGGTEDDDVWFSFVATSTSHRISVLNAAGSTTDMYHSLWTGAACGSLTLVAGTCSDPNTSNPSGLVIGQTYYVRVYTWTATAGQTVTFDICVGSPPPPPNNDSCTGAIALTVNPDLACGSVTAGTTTSATASGINDAGCGGTEDDDVWFTFVATATTHNITLSSVAGTVTDMYHSLWTGADCSSLTLVPGSCSDPNSSSPSGLVIGQTYYVRVYTSTATAGQSVTFNICVGTLPAPPVNDNCSGAIALTVNPDLACGSVTAGTITSATASGINDAGCGGTEDDDVWFSFVATATTHNITLSGVSGTVTDMYHSLWTGADCGSLTLVAGTCSDPNTSNPVGLVIGQTYYVRVYTFTGTAGQIVTFNICVGTPPPPPANDACATAITMPSLPYTNTQDATSATNNTGYVGTCTTTTGMNDGVWYTFTVGTPGNVSVVLSGVTGWDPEVAVYSGSCGAFTCMGAVDAGGSGGGETLNLTSLAAGQYWVNVGYYSGTTNNPEGPFTITVTGTAVLLSSHGFDMNAFKAYPNPVKDILTLTYSSQITSVEVYNMLGQKVLTKPMNLNEGQVDMSNLNAGNYIVKVTADGLTKTIKVIKE